MDLSSRLFPAPLHEFGTPRSAPAPGATEPGDLYCDLQSRTLWLGVDASVDPAEAVLVSDIITLTQAIMDAEADANAYTDAQLLTRAPLNHTHTASQITDLTSAVTDIVEGIPGFNWVKGMIMMYAGSLAEIGVGQLAGWALCDGFNGTPDLRDRFIIGAGNKPSWPANGSINPGGALNTGTAGSHTHTINGTILTVNQMPAHQHPVTGSGNGTATGYDNVAGSHTHGISGSSAHLSTSGSGGWEPGPYGNIAASYAGDHQHYHNLSVSVAVSANAATAGGSQSHTHTENSTGDHYHTIGANGIRDSLAYVALAYIMKL